MLYEVFLREEFPSSLIELRDLANSYSGEVKSYSFELFFLSEGLTVLWFFIFFSSFDY